MVYNFSEHPSVANTFIAELRDVKIQQDRMRFRRNLERLSEVMAYEISKTLTYSDTSVETPLGEASAQLSSDKIVIATIMRAGLPMQQGMLRVFDQAGCAFISAYRMHHKDGSFEINMEYISCPDLEGKVLIVTDPMLATGASMKMVLDALIQNGKPAKIHIASAIAAQYGVQQVRRFYPDAQLWIGGIDEELTAKSYIVPGLGDAGDLAYGEKLQE